MKWTKQAPITCNIGSAGCAPRPGKKNSEKISAEASTYEKQQGRTVALFAQHSRAALPTILEAYTSLTTQVEHKPGITTSNLALRLPCIPTHQEAQSTHLPQHYE